MDIYKIDFDTIEDDIQEITDSVILEKPIVTIMESVRATNEIDINWCNVSSEPKAVWTDWAKMVQCISHFLLTLYSSVTFPIYYAKTRSTNLH